ncbi:MAG: tetratricopeptide repeat protein, partial [Aeromicrobium sp.]|nr:tetratricopeptide repeat protein [Burkholderiales bacterium]
VLSLEVVDDRPADPVAKLALNPAAATIPAGPASPAQNDAMSASMPRASVIPATAVTLEDMLEGELGHPSKEALAESIPTPPATAAFRASRLPPAQNPAELLVSYAPAYASPPSLEPLAAPKSGSAGLDFAPPPTQSESPQQASNREAIKNAFAVKQVAPAGGKAKWIIPVAAVLLAVTGAGGWYVWNEMTRLGKPVARLPAAPVPTITTPPTAPAAAATTGTTTAATGPNATGANAQDQTPPAVASKTASLPEEAPLPPLLPPPAIQLKEERAPTAAKVVAATPREALARKIEALPLTENLSGGVKLLPAKPVILEINPTLAAGYTALAAGDYTTAKRRYAEAIASNGNSADAHLGFATAAARSGSAADVALAVSHYQRVLEIDPRNSTAGAALIVLAGGRGADSPAGLSSSTEKELELTRLLAQDPNAANVHFLLGNLYAESRRWREAQPAYFEAARLMPQNADYCYNLAVSLDQLGQGAAAVNFYRSAITATIKGQFDRAAVERRIAALSTSASAKRQP